MIPRIESIEEKKFIGRNQKMSITDDKTFNLFAGFMPRKKEITNSINTDVLDLKVYPQDYFKKFDPSKYFTKWALVEVTNLEFVPNEMEAFVLPTGEYAVFTQKGLITDNSIFQYIYIEWLPNSDYTLDNRPHFDVLGEKIQQRDPNSEQIIWIPIKSVIKNDTHLETLNNQ